VSTLSTSVSLDPNRASQQAVEGQAPAELLAATLQAIEPLDQGVLQRAAARQAVLTKPAGSLGLLEVLGNQYAAVRRQCPPVVGRKRIYVVAADHGVTAEGVSAYPRDVTWQMVGNFLAGGAAVSVLARQAGIEVCVVDAGVDHDFSDASGSLPPGLINAKHVAGSANMARGTALSPEQVLACIASGIRLAAQAAADGVTLLGVGEMGIGNTTAAAAITSAVTGNPPRTTVGRGTGIDDPTLERKIAVVEAALSLHAPSPHQPLEILAAVGGAEIATMVGLYLGAACHRVLVVVDGYIATAAAVLAWGLQPAVRDSMVAAHRSQEPGHGLLLSWMGLEPLLALQLRLGEASGSALAMPLVEAAARVLGEMATFDGAGVAGPAAAPEAAAT
jgi:nicotinate-nucleotide--dimethylbenzimidazole phosphoribosyltransferase